MMCGTDVYFWRQFFILTAGLFYSTSIGFMLSFPAVLNPSILAPNTTDIRATADQASWLAASNGLAGMFGFLILSPIFQIYGRKAVHIGCNILSLTGWIIFPLANSITILFVARMTQGLAIGGIFINSIIVGEYIDPTRRGYFMTIKKISIAFGTLCCHSMSLFWTWRQIAYFAVMLPSVAIILTFFWPESPSYLAMKGRFEECKKSHTWLNGTSSQYDTEVNLLISSQIERQKEKNSKKKRKVRDLLKTFLEKDFQRAFLIVALLTLVLDLSGRYYFVAYVIQIMAELLEDKSLAIYCSVGSDCLIIVALLTSCYVIRCFKRRTLLFTFGLISVVLMFLVSLLVFLKSKYSLGSLAWMTPCVILMQNFIINIGVTPVAFAITGEVIPLEHKGVGSFSAGIIFTSLYSLTLKLTPVLMASTGLEGTYGIYALCLALSLVLLYFIVPETKDKTLQEIEIEIKSVKKSITKLSSKEGMNLL